MPFHAAYVFDDVDDIYWAHEWLLNDVINLHAPVKERISKPKKPAFINGDLRRAIFKKKKNASQQIQKGSILSEVG